MRVLVVDDNELWRSSLVKALEDRGVTVVAEAAGEQELHARLLRANCSTNDVDVAVLDLRLPPTWSDEGVHLARRLRATASNLGIIILSGYEQDVQLYYATRALSDLEGDGGVGYLTKDRVTRVSLIESMERVADGRIVVDPIFSREAVNRYQDHHQRDAGFSAREVEVLDLLVQGATNREIGQKLHLSEPVVERHMTQIFQKIVPSDADREACPSQSRPSRRENRRVLAVLEWLRRSGRMNS